MTDYSAIIRDHLTKQRARSVAVESFLAIGQQRCKYRGANGRMCAVGCLIPDDKYDREMEGASVQIHNKFNATGKRKLLWDALPKDLDPKLATAWQRYHDSSYAAGTRAYSYSKWLAGEEIHSPAALYEYLKGVFQ